MKKITAIFIFIHLTGFTWLCHGHLQFPPLNIDVNESMKCFEGTFVLEVNKSMNKETIVRYMMPVRQTLDGHLSCHADNLIFYAPYNGEAKKIRHKLPDWISVFAQTHGYGVFSMTIETDKKHVNDEDTYYIYENSGWHDIIWETAKYLRNEFLISEERLIVVGESCGGSMAQQLTARHPEKILKAGWHGGARYAPMHLKTKVDMLALSTWGDVSAGATARMVKEAKNNHVNILFFQMPPVFRKNGEIDQHAAGKDSYALITDFILGDLEKVKGRLAKLPGQEFEKELFYQYPSENKLGISLLILWEEEMLPERDLLLKNAMWKFEQNGYSPSFFRCRQSDLEATYGTIDNWRKSSEGKKVILGNRLRDFNGIVDVQYIIWLDDDELLNMPSFLIRKIKQ